MTDSSSTRASRSRSRHPLSGRALKLFVGVGVGVIALIMLLTGVFNRASEQQAPVGAAPAARAGDGPRPAGTSGDACPEARDLYAAPNGLPGNNGSIAQPIDLATALSDKSPARPCDTVWLRGGTYKGAFVASVKGKEGAPIIFRQYPGERVTLAGPPTPETVLMVMGDWTWYWGFEITNPDATRSTKELGQWPSDLRRGTGVAARGSYVKFINLVVHDVARGFEVGAESVGTEIYGSIIYHNGWEGPDGTAHGHGIETQNGTDALNRPPVRRIADNIIFNQFSYGIAAYAKHLNNITLEGNAVFGNGSLSRAGVTGSRNVLLGGGIVAKTPVLRDNMLYLGQTNLGYDAGCADGTVTGNYFAAPLVLVRCTPDMKDNVFYDPDHGSFGTLPSTYPRNTFHTTAPSGTVVRVRRNQFEPERSNIGIFNWEKHSEVSVDLAATGLQRGDKYEIRDAQNYFGPVIATNSYDGNPVKISPGSLKVAAPVGTVPVKPKHTAPEFVVLVLTKQGARTPTGSGAPR